MYTEHLQLLVVKEVVVLGEDNKINIKNVLTIQCSFSLCLLQYIYQYIYLLLKYISKMLSDTQTKLTVFQYNLSTKSRKCFSYNKYKITLHKIKWNVNIT